MKINQTQQRVARALRRGALWTGCAAALALSACGGSGGSGSSGTGSLRLALTDAPSCDYKAVNVTVQKVRMHKSGSAGENDSGWSEVALPEDKQIELTRLTNGRVEELGQTALPAGKYTQLRLVLAPNTGANPLANSVTLGDNSVVALTTPSGQQSGLKTKIDIDVTEGKLADFVLDFKVCESIVKRGNSGQYNLKPVIAMLPRVSGAGVVGYLDSGLDPAKTVVSLQLDGKPVRATPPDSTGKFVLFPVPVGNYDLVVNSQGRVTALVTGVPVVETAYTTVNSGDLASRISPPMSAMLNASGTVNAPAPMTVATVDATLRVLKTYTDGPTVELVAAPVDEVTGVFSHELPVGAPVRAKFVDIALGFNTDAATPTGRYTLQARAGTEVKNVDIDLSTADSMSTITTAP